MKDEEEETTHKKRDKQKKRKRKRMYRLGSQGLEGVHYDDDDSEDDPYDSGDSDGEGGPDSDAPEVLESEQEPESEESEEEDLEAAGFRQDSEDINDPADGNREDELDENMIQIMELHSEEPMVLFRGKYYKCQWVSNIGTELLFTKHDPDDDNPLPCLRTLPGDVALLAASSARIMGTEVILEPKGHKTQKVRRPRLKVKDLSIQVGRGARRERKEQAKFLEELINAKLGMGELDAVTVDAQSRKSVWKWGEFFKAKTQHEIAKLQKIIRAGGEGAAEAAARLQTLEEEQKQRDGSIDLVARKQGKPGKGSGQKTEGDPEGPPKPNRGRPALGKLRERTPERSSPAVVRTPNSAMGSVAHSSPEDFDDDTEDSELDDDDSEEADSEEESSEEGDSEDEDTEQGDSEEDDTEQGDSDEEDNEVDGSDEEHIEEGDGEDEDGFPNVTNSEEEGSFDEDADEDEDASMASDEDTNIYA